MNNLVLYAKNRNIGNSLLCRTVESLKNVGVRNYKIRVFQSKL